MPVVVDQMEVIPAPATNNQPAGAKPDETGEKKKPPISDFEAKKMIRRVLDRLERVSAH